MIVRDRDVRSALRAHALVEHYADPGTLVLDELGLLNGRARVDVAVVNGAIHGYELKSASDTLTRLPAQIAAYGAVLDFVTIVVASDHLEGALRLVPSWWGVVIAKTVGNDEVQLEDARAASMNVGIDPSALATLLWRDEVIEELKQRGAFRGVAGKPPRELYRRLTEVVQLEDLRAVVRRRLKQREGWRVASPRT